MVYFYLRNWLEQEGKPQRPSEENRLEGGEAELRRRRAIGDSSEGPMKVAGRRRWLRALPWPLLAVLALGASLRFPYLSRESLWYDEAYSVYWAQRSLLGEPSDVNPPFYNALLHFWMQFFGTTEAAARSLSALFGMASLYLIYRVGTTLFDQKVGLIAAFLSSFSLFYIEYSLEARSYSLLLMLSLLSYLHFIRITQGGKKRSSLVFYVMSNTLLVYSHVFGLFILASQMIYLALFRRRDISLHFAANAVTLALFLPWLSGLFSGDRLAAVAWLQEPTLERLLFTLKAYLGNLNAVVATYAGKPELVPFQGSLFYLFLLMSLLGLSSLVRLADSSPEADDARPRRTQGIVSWEKVPEVSLLLVWLVLPILLPFIISKLFMPIYTLRYTIGASPALYILAALGICRWKRAAVALSISGLFLFLSFPALNYYHTHPHKEQWRETALLLEKNAKEGDAVVVNCDGPAYLPPLEYYYRGGIEPALLRAKDWKPEKVGPFLERVSQDKERLWLVSSYGQGSPVIRDILKKRYRLIQTKELSGISVDLFSLEMEGMKSQVVDRYSFHPSSLLCRKAPCSSTAGRLTSL